ncbi:MAG: hypothetical protein A3G59_00100 [Candidatus Taylorbacteria bacterium RIFCSPLOWO2_12_FULL_47_20]|uniref:Cell division protein FtsX n=2 Tax=Candidatus Tayloriibacteriota TaxID=1817919 RepID=A0A1G2P7A3_9BACT|nr:MAG: hypothetical protein A3H68_00175 [Candidatus Taylorbacteria bacterium RIFCSPLOWO2_02_FULL_46_40]OHA44208.1 MAG: hypothetical protein A3G59_00100 [Candidatus Taylorbacteria bacterium RIFCSPLOWO2_12_FULL_47_20]
MLITSIKRIIRTGFVGFWRNAFVSLSAVLVLSVTLFVVGSLVFNNKLLSSSLGDLKDKVDVNVYFVTSASENDILSIKKSLEALPEVMRVTYISREQALADYRERHKDDPRMLEPLDELDDNPLGAVLNVKTREPSQYEGVADFLEKSSPLSAAGGGLVERVNFNENKAAITRLQQIIDNTEKSNIARTLVLALISIVVTFNTIRLAIFTSREEISVMQLVGASNSYVRGPFVIVGVMYGLAAALAAVVAFYPLTYWFGPLFYPFPLFLSDNLGDFTLFNYYMQNFGQMFLIIVVSGIVLGAISSYLAVRRYLKV